MLKKCQWKGRTVSCSAIFSKQPTDRGMCCSFNKEKADRMYRESPYREQIDRLSNQDKAKSSEQSSLPEW